VDEIDPCSVVDEGGVMVVELDGTFEVASKMARLRSNGLRVVKTFLLCLKPPPLKSFLRAVLAAAKMLDLTLGLRPSGPLGAAVIVVVTEDDVVVEVDRPA